MSDEIQEQVVEEQLPEPTVVHCVAPLGMDALKVVFEDKSTIFEFDVEENKPTMNSKALLIYTANLGMKTNIINPDMEALKYYMTLQSINNDVNLPWLHANVLLFARTGEMMYPGAEGELFYQQFVEQNVEMIARQCQFIDSMILYQQFIYEDTTEEQIIEMADEVDPETYEDIGLNIVNLFALEPFLVDWFALVPPLVRTYFKTYFNEYMFQGKNLFAWYAVNNNYFMKMAMVLKQNNYFRDQLAEETGC